MKTNLTGVGELQKEGVGSGDVIFPQGQVGGMRHNHPSHLYFGYERDSGAAGEAIWSSAILRFELASDEIVWTVERAHSRSPWRMRLFMKVDGRCHCGAIAYSADVEPEMASICHCTDCQCFSGAPFRASVPANVEDFRLLHGNPKIYVKIADSGARRRQAFCGECGTSIYASAFENTTVLNLRVGAIKQRSEIPPRRQIWCSSALSWTLDVRTLPSSLKE
jgi:hypothetical protein